MPLRAKKGISYAVSPVASSLEEKQPQFRIVFDLLRRRREKKEEKVNFDAHSE